MIYSTNSSLSLASLSTRQSYNRTPLISELPLILSTNSLFAHIPQPFLSMTLPYSSCTTRIHYRAKTLSLSLRKNHHRNFALSFEFSFCRIVLRYHSNKVIATSFSGRVGCLNLVVWLVVNFWTSRQLNSFNP